MPDYKFMYYRLAGKVADAIDLLTQAQQEGEELSMDGYNAPLLVLKDGLLDESQEESQ